MPFTLDMLPVGRHGRITGLPGGVVRSQAIRFGLAEGASILLYERIPRGPVVIRRGLQEIAIGRALARSITVDSE
ncbi:MAG: ferrous iron transport protein A [Bacillota bacterium]